MAYRYTNTDKWSDAWFSELKPLEKLLFNYLCDNCDIAGFIEFTPKKWAFDIGDTPSKILGAFEGLGRGLIVLESNDCVYIKNFLKHQKNWPLNEKNNAHLGIIKRFEEYKIKFKIDSIESFINQQVEPLPRGYGNGNGKGSDKVVSLSYEEYIGNLREEFEKAFNDLDWIKERQTFHPRLDIKKTIEKSCIDYWATDAGYKNKIKSKSKTIEWRSTFNNSLTQKCNQVYLQNKNYIHPIANHTNEKKYEQF